MLNPDIRITKQLEDARFVDGQAVPHVRVEFMVGTHGPFTVRIPKDAYMQGERDAQIEAYARNIRVS